MPRKRENKEELVWKKRPEHISISPDKRQKAIEKILERNPRMDDDTKKQMIEHMERNGRWGTCVDCPSEHTDNGYYIFPEKCPNTDRYDHWLGVDALEE